MTEKKKIVPNRFAAVPIRASVASAKAAPAKSDKQWMMSVKLDQGRYSAIKTLAQKNKEAGLAELGSAQGIFLAALDKYLSE